MTPDKIARSAPVWAMATGQMLSFACMFYIFAALILTWNRDLGWDKTTLGLGPMAAILVTAAMAPICGRLVDKGYSRLLMAAGPVIGAMALVGLSQMTALWQWVALWAVMGLAQSMCQYEVCFAFLIRRLGPAGRAAIVRITLIAGLSGSIAFPAGAALAAALGWRATMLIAAAVMILTVLPLNLWSVAAIRARGPAMGLPKAGAAGDAGALRRALGHGGFWLLALIFALAGLNHWMIVNLAVPVFTAQGAPEAMAVAAAACIGPAQFIGRLTMLGGGRLTSGGLFALTVAGSALASVLLLFAGVAPLLAFGYAALQGAAIGIVTILRPVMTAEVLGPEGYGAISGAIQIPAMTAGALAPVIGAAILTGLGPGALGLFSLGLLGLTLAALALLRRRHKDVIQPG